MTGDASTPTPIRSLGILLAVAAAYYIAGRSGQLLAIQPGNVTAVWPPSGIALAAILLFGHRVWPGIWIGSFLASVWALFDASTARSVLVSTMAGAGIGVGAVLEAAAGAFLLQRFIGRHNPLSRVQDVIKLLLLGGPVSCLVSATLGVSCLRAGGFIESSAYPVTWLTWWLGDTAGVILFTPLILAWTTLPRDVWQPRQIVHAMLLLTLLVVVGGFVFCGWWSLFKPGFALAYVPIPLTVWAAYQWGYRGAAFSSLVLAVMALIGTIGGTAPFAQGSFNESLLSLQVYVATVVGTALTLAAVVAEREHLEAQFRQAQKMDAVGRLAGGIAHDFNNLLTVITGYCDILLERLDPQSPLRYEITEIKKAGDRAAGLSAQLLVFSRKQVVQPALVDLNEVVTHVSKMLRRLIGEDIQLRLELGTGIGLVKADRGQLEQILVNLAVNARDAMPQGGTLTIETNHEELGQGLMLRDVSVTPGSYVRLGVSDTGTGMDAETLAHIFEPFFTTKEAGKGTGLGLSTVYGIVKQSSGYIAAHNEPGGGAMFKIYLPRIEQVAQPAGPAAQGLPPPRGSETILLVEPDETVRHLARQVLEAGGYRVLVARDAKEAALASEGHRGRGTIHLLLSDVVMPDDSGMRMAQRLMLSRPGMKVLYISGSAEHADARHGVEPGFAYVQKPFTPDVLVRTVRDVLDNQPSQERKDHLPG